MMVRKGRGYLGVRVAHGIICFRPVLRRVYIAGIDLLGLMVVQLTHATIMLWIQWIYHYYYLDY